MQLTHAKILEYLLMLISDGKIQNTCLKIYFKPLYYLLLIISPGIFMAAITYPLVLNIATLVRQILPMNQKAFLSTNQKKNNQWNLK